jgi:membrane-bound ClpP family serine protease
MIDQLLVAVAAFLSVGIYRWISGRVVTIEGDDTVSQPTQFRIFDLLILISLVALMLAITMRFKNELQGWDGLAYVVLIFVGLYFGSPIGAIVPLFLIGILSKAKETVVFAIFALVFVLCIGLGTVLAFHMDEKARIEALPFFDTLRFSLSVLALVLANTFAIRGLCYRLCKLPRKGKSESNEHTSNMNGEPSYARDHFL